MQPIIVTALRRQQPSQDVPAALSVLTGLVLKGTGAQDFRDYLTTVPGVNYTESGLGAMRVTIRGISNGVGATDPTTGIYIDEAPVTESFYATFDPDIYDVDRVEILKGPQGTLYGAGSMGGTIRVIGNKPKLDVYEATAQGIVTGVAHGGADGQLDAMVNLPIRAEKAALRISAGHRAEPGWIDDLRRGDRDANTVEKNNFRAQLLLKPGAHTTVTVGFTGQAERRGLPSQHDLGLPEHQTGRVFGRGGASDAQLYSLTVQHDWGGASLISATNYLRKHSLDTLDATATLRPLVARLAHVTLGPEEGVGLDSGDDFHLTTQEVRLTSRGRRRIDWSAGAFYSRGVTDAATAFDFTQAPSIGGVVAGGAFYSSNQRYRIRQLAAFGELTLNISDKLSLTAGLRAFDVSQHNTFIDSGLLNGGLTRTLQHNTSASVTQKYLLKYQASRSRMVYAQTVQGYRNGGPTGSTPATACGPALTALGYPAVPTSYGPDKLWNYEIGSKNTLFHGRMQLNGAVYYVDWRDIQSSIGLSCGFTFIVNSGKAVSRGAELETLVRPLEGLSVTGGLAYVDAKLTQVAPGAGAKDGDPLPLTAPWSWNVAAQYERDLPNGLTGFLRGEINHVGKRWNTFRSGAGGAAPMDAYTTVGARFGVRTGRWSLALFGSNLTDERIVTFVNLPGTAYEIVGRPRTVGVASGLKF